MGHRLHATVTASTNASAPFNQFAVELPEVFDFRQPEAWKKRKTRFERFRIISALHTKDEEPQINTVLYAMGSNAEDVLISMPLPEDESQDYEKLVAAFDISCLGEIPFMSRHAPISASNKRMDP